MTEYNKISIDKAIKSDKTIGKKESKLIHGLLRGRHRPYSGADLAEDFLNEMGADYDKY